MKSSLSLVAEAGAPSPRQCSPRRIATHRRALPGRRAQTSHTRSGWHLGHRRNLNGQRTFCHSRRDPEHDNPLLPSFWRQIHPDDREWLENPSNQAVATTTNRTRLSPRSSRRLAQARLRIGRTSSTPAGISHRLHRHHDGQHPAPAGQEWNSASKKPFRKALELAPPDDPPSSAISKTRILRVHRDLRTSNGFTPEKRSPQ